MKVTFTGKSAIIVGLVVILCLISLPGFAAHPDDEYRDSSDAGKMFHKLGRGIVNICTCWLEIPKQIAKEWKRTDPFTGTVLGFFKGGAWGVGRLMVGVYDTVSFPLPIPKDYEPLMEPEFVLTDLWGESIDFYEPQ